MYNSFLIQQSVDIIADDFTFDEKRNHYADYIQLMPYERQISIVKKHVFQCLPPDHENIFIM
jgi:hypothetical protein